MRLNFKNIFKTNKIFSYDNFKYWPELEKVHICVLGAEYVRNFKKGREIPKGTLIADFPDKSKAAIHSSIDGKVISANEFEIVLKKINFKGPVEIPPLLDLKPLKGEQLIEALRLLGVLVPPLIEKDDTLIISALNPEPGINYTEALLNEYQELLNDGLAVYLSLLNFEPKIIWVHHNKKYLKENDIFWADNYPYTQNYFLKSKILNTPLERNPKGVLSLKDLYLMGKVYRTGFPLTEVPLSLEKGSYLIPIGTSVKEILKEELLRASADIIVFEGGYMRGKPYANLLRGISVETEALYLSKYKKNKIEKCISCLLCHAVCPVKLRIDLLSIAYDFAKEIEFNTEKCLDCNLCSYVCPQKRPLKSILELKLWPN